MADRRLQVFSVVAKQMSFTKAAEILHMTQPAVTFQIRQLEEYFNTRLFDRTHNRIALTKVGQLIHEYAERIIALHEEMENEVKQLTNNVSGVLLLGASTTIAEYMLPALLGDFKKQYPQLLIRLTVSNTENIVSLVESNAIDLGVVEAPVSNRNLVVDLCKTDPLVAVVPKGHPLITRKRQKKLLVKELLNYPYICREEGSGTREVINDYLEKNGVSPGDMNVVLELGSPESIKGAVAAGMGISVLSRATVGKELQLGQLDVIELSPPLERPYSFVHQKQKFRVRAMEELLSFAREYCVESTREAAEE